MSTSQEHLLTVITVTFNNLSGLKETYQSISMQTYPDFTWLVIDGGSTDGTVEWLASLDMPHLQYISEPDDGIYFAMNKGIEAFATEYCQFLNAGDSFYDEHVLALVVPILAHKQPIFAYGAHLHGAVPGYPERLRKCHLRHRWELLLGKMPCHQTMFYSRRAFEEFRAFDTNIKVTADFDWLLEFMVRHKADDFLFFDFPIVRYDANGVSYHKFFHHTPSYLKMLAKEKNPVARLFGGLGWLRAATYVVISKTRSMF